MTELVIPDVLDSVDLLVVPEQVDGPKESLSLPTRSPLFYVALDLLSRSRELWLDSSVLRGALRCDDETLVGLVQEMDGEHLAGWPTHDKDFVQLTPKGERWTDKLLWQFAHGVIHSRLQREDFVALGWPGWLVEAIARRASNQLLVRLERDRLSPISDEHGLASTQFVQACLFYLSNTGTAAEDLARHFFVSEEEASRWIQQMARQRLAQIDIGRSYGVMTATQYADLRARVLTHHLVLHGPSSLGDLSTALDLPAPIIVFDSWRAGQWGGVIGSRDILRSTFSSAEWAEHLYERAVEHIVLARWGGEQSVVRSVFPSLPWASAALRQMVADNIVRFHDSPPSQRPGQAPNHFESLVDLRTWEEGHGPLWRDRFEYDPQVWDNAFVNTEGARTGGAEPPETPEGKPPALPSASDLNLRAQDLRAAVELSDLRPEQKLAHIEAGLADLRLPAIRAIETFLNLESERLRAANEDDLRPIVSRIRHLLTSLDARISCPKEGCGEPSWLIQERGGLSFQHESKTNHHRWRKGMSVRVLPRKQLP